ncbi:MAG: ABC transporter permease, partial [Pseudomonadales bacterium]
MASANAGTLQRKLAWRFFSGGSSSALVSMISSISLAGMVIAVALLVLVLSIMNGFEREFRERILGLVPHATLWLDRDSDMSRELAILRSRPAIKYALPFIEFKALAIRGAVTEPVLVQGTDYARFRERARDFIRSGDAAIPAGLEAGQLILGHGIATKLGLQVGDKLRLMVMDNPGHVAMGDELPRRVAAGQRTTVHTVELVATLH